MYTASFIALTLFSVRPKVQLRLLADMCSSQENWPITADPLPIPNTQSVVRQVNSAWHLVRQSLPHSLKLLEVVYSGWMQRVCVFPEYLQGYTVDWNEQEQCVFALASMTKGNQEWICECGFLAPLGISQLSTWWSVWLFHLRPVNWQGIALK